MDVKIGLVLVYLIVNIVCAAGGHNKNRHISYKSSSIGGNVNIQIVYNESNSLIAATNVLANVSSIIDFKNNINAFLNGVTKSGVVIDLSFKKCFQLSNNNLLWDAYKTSVGTYINSLKYFSALLKAAQENGKEIELTNSVIASLTTELGLNLKGVNTSQLLQELSEITKLVNGTLKGLYDGYVSVFIDGGLQRFNSIHFGLGKLLSSANGGLQAALNGSKVNVTEILSGSNSLEILLSVFKQIGARSNLEKLLGNVVNNGNELLKVLYILAGGQTKGVDGIINLIFNLIASSGAPNPNDLVIVVLDLLESGKPLSASWSQLVKLSQSLIVVVKEQQQKFGANNLQDFQGILSSLIAGTIKIDNVDLSGVIKVIQSGNFTGGLDLIIKILVSLGNVNQSIPQLFQSVIKFVNITDDVNLLGKLIPGIDANSLNSIKTINFTQIFSGGDVFAQIAKLPVVGAIWSQISKSAGATVDLSNILNPSVLQGIFINPSSTGEVTNEIQNGISNVVNGLGSIGGSFEGALGGIFGQLGSSSGSESSENGGSGSESGLNGFDYFGSVSGGVHVGAGITVGGSGSVSAGVSGSGSGSVEGGVTVGGSGGISNSGSNNRSGTSSGSAASSGSVRSSEFPSNSSSVGAASRGARLKYHSFLHHLDEKTRKHEKSH